MIQVLAEMVGFAEVVPSFVIVEDLGIRYLKLLVVLYVSLY